MERDLRRDFTRALDGDGRAYAAFLGSVARMARGYLMRSRNRAISVEAVEDLVQDVLLAVHNKRHLYERGRPVLPWLFAIARYRLIDHVRAQAARPPAVALEELPESALAGDEALDRSLEVEGLLAGLSDKQRRALILAKLEGRPLREVGDRLGMSLAAVKVAVHRALALLRRRHGRNDEDR